MPARLLVFFAERPARDFVLEEPRDYVVGRDAGAELVVDDDRVSRRHARLRAGSGLWRLADLGSKNGTLLDGAPIAAERPLPADAWVSFGGVPARFQLLDGETRDRLLADRRDRRQTTQGLARELDPAAGREAIFDRILAALVSLTEADRAWLLLARANGEIDAVRERPRGGDTSPAFRGSRGAVARALAELQPVVLADVRADEELARRSSVVAGGVRAVICVPLTREERTLGALYADARRPGSAFTELDVELLAALAEHASLALDALRLSGELAEITGRTGLDSPPRPAGG